MNRSNVSTAKKNKLKKGHYRFGYWAEHCVCWLLMLQGYRLLKKRYRTPVGEVDLIVSKGQSLVFVEVKARRQATQLAEAITQNQQMRIMRAAEYFIACHPRYHTYNMRFDVVWVQPWRWPCHMRNVWFLSTSRI
jgi:putative endonuclease